jgi:hypothetical protein
LVANARVVHKEEQLVLEDWTTEGSAKDRLREGLARNGGELIEPGIGIEFVVFEEGEGRSVEVICTAFQDGNDVSAVDVSVLCSGVRSDGGQVLDRVWTGIVADGVVDGLVDLDAIEKIVVTLIAISVDRDLTIGTGAAFDRIHTGHAGWRGVDRAGKKLGDR